MGWQDDPIVGAPQARTAPPAAGARGPATPVAPGAGGPPAASPAPWQQDQSVEDIVRSMSREQMVDYYHTSKPGDPVADMIERVLSQPMQGESPEQTDQRLYGNMPDQFSRDGSIMAGWADGAAMGGADEIAGAVGGVKSWMGGDGYMPGYEQSRDKAREALRVAEDEHPWDYRGGNVLGGITQGVAMGPGAPAQSLGARVATGAGIGSGLGAGYSFLSGEGGFKERMKDVPVSAAIGAGLGAAFPALSAGAGWLRGRWKDKGLDQQSTGKIADMLEDTAMPFDQVQKVATRQGPLGTISDVNEGMQVAAGGTSVAGGSSIMAPPLAARREGAPGRVKQELSDAFGKPVGSQKVKDMISEAREPAGPAYEKAKQYILDTTPVAQKIDSLLGTFGPDSNLGKMLGRYRKQLVDKAGNLIEKRGDVLHGIREQLDDEIDNLFLRKKGKMASRLSEVRRVVDGILKTQVPGFEEADKIWSDTSKIQKAYDYGKDKVLGRVHPSEVKAKVGKMPDPEFAANRAGVRDSIEMDMSQPMVNAGKRAERILERNMNDQKLPLYTTPERADKLARALDNEQTFMETSNLVEPSRNSRTAPLSAAAQRYWGSTGRAGLGDAAIDTMAGAGAGFALGGPAGAVAGGVGAATGKVRDMIANFLTKGPTQDLVNATATKLVAQGPVRDRLIADIIKRSGDKLTKAQAGQKLDATIRTLTSGLPATGADVYNDRRSDIEQRSR